ncbi:hypothetical protein [Streptomyces lunaelactis]|uniref:hypothetical protein n=1 Tax=Streptomyces lunaelactis TaxID=1535768 RepID=UPI001585A77D|nr:hypothetical protein [Streptomyces lunaelactis]NUK01113.1 hypothetical protein [Streptomyces lunaelactis]NUK16857.1 hypothetical protein [Streptomyces lunaelactis]
MGNEGKNQKGRKHRTPQKRAARRPSVPKPRAAPQFPSALPLKGNLEMQATLLEKAPPEQLVELLMPHLWASIAEESGAPSNICVDAALTLRHAFGQYGIRSVIQPVDLIIRDQRGNEEVYRTSEQSWSADGTVFHGHCLLALPDSQRIVDATVEQFEQVAAVGAGPLIGKTAAADIEAPPGQLLPERSTLVLQRGQLLLRYTVVEEPLASIINDQQPYVRSHAAEHHRAGVNLASLMLLALRDPEVIGRARQTPYPRLRALLRAVAGADHDVDSERNFRFLLPDATGQKRGLRLDEVPLPPTTPQAYPRG